MAQPTRSQRFMQKAEAALVAAIEIYNKPDFRYREESFAILALNAWELLLKARLLSAHGNDPKYLYVYETRAGKRGKPTKKRYRKRNRAGNCQTLGLGATIVSLERGGVTLPPGVRKNLDAMTEVRDNAVHFIAAGPLLTKQVFEFGTAAVANFLRLAREWFAHDMSKYHLYLMPLGLLERRDPEGLGKPLEAVDGDVFLAALDRADVGPMKPAGLSEAFLGVTRRTSKPPDRLSYPESKGRHPGRQHFDMLPRCSRPLLG